MNLNERAVFIERRLRNLDSEKITDGADGGGRPVEVAANLIAELRAKFAAAEAHAENIQSETVERCACFVENGSFLHDQSPAKLFAVQCAKAMRVALAQKQTK